MTWPVECAHGALARYITETDANNFQPMNVNFGLFPPLSQRVHKKERKMALAKRALAVLDEWRRQNMV